MLGGLLFLLYGDLILTFFAGLSEILGSETVALLTDPDHSKLFEKADFMFPDNFLSRYPHEADALRLKIFAYLIFNILVKAYSKKDPVRFWSDYNHDDFKRSLIDAVFYEYLTNFTETPAKSLLYDPISKSSRSEFSEEMAVHRIGQYLDRLSETESRQDRLKGAYEILSERNASPTSNSPTSAKCGRRPLIETLGIPGIDYPNFCDFPETSFSCADKRIPGIYADYETGCQAFHTCWSNRMDSFLCPTGTIFNQSLLTCDTWRNTGCFSSSVFFNSDQFLIDGISTESDIPKFDGNCESLLNKPLQLHTKFLPTKCEVKYLKNGKLVTIKPHEDDKDKFRTRLETAYEMVREMLDMLREIRNELEDEMTSRGTARLLALAKGLDSRSVPKLSAKSANDAIENTRIAEENRFNSPKGVEQIHRSGKLSPILKPSRTLRRSALLRPSKSLKKVHSKSSRKQGIPKIVMKSLGLGGTFLNKGIIPVTKQMIIDSYRKIKSIKH